MAPTVRLATFADAALLPAIETSAGESFRALPDLAWIADEEIGGSEIYPARIAEGCLWVVEDSPEGVAGFLSAQPFGAELHVWELAVAQPSQRRGLGRLLLDAAQHRARVDGLAALTLTTFRHVAWNAPFYERYGFRTLEGAETGARLAETLRLEAERGLPDRCAMRLLL